MIIIRRSKDRQLILHNLLNHTKREMSPGEEKVILKKIPELNDPKINSWLLSEEPEELLKKF
jgi:uncharacterized protein YeeX (DUF496 family)